MKSVWIIAIILTLNMQLAYGQGRPDILWMQAGHPNNVIDLAFTSDNQFVATASEHAYQFGAEIPDIKLWRVSDQKLVRVFTAFAQGLSPGRGLYSVAISPNGEVLACGTGYQVFLWRVSDGSFLRVITGLPGYVHSLTFSPDSSTLFAAASYQSSRSITMWRVSDGMLLRTMVPSQVDGQLTSISVNHDGSLLCSVLYQERGSSRTSNVTLWSTADGSIVRTIVLDLDHPPLVATFSPDGQLVAVGGNFSPSTVRLYDVSNGDLVREMTGHTADIESVAFTPDGSTLVSGSLDHTIKFWRVSDGFLLNSFTGDSSGVRAVAVSPDGQTLASGGYERVAKLWRLPEGELMGTLGVGHTKVVTKVEFSSDGQMIATSGGDDRTVRLWNVADGSLIKAIPVPGIRKSSLSPDGGLVAAGWDAGVAVHRVSDGAAIASLPGGSPVAFSPDGRLLAASHYPAIRLWEVEDRFDADGNSWELLQVIGGLPHGPGDSAEFSPDGSILAVTGDDVRLLRVADGSLIRVLNHQNPAAVSFSSDGLTIASAGSTGPYEIKLWRVGDGALLQSFAGHAMNVNSVDLSPYRNAMISGSRDATVRLWFLDGGIQQVYDQYTDGNVTDVAYSPNGQLIAYGHAEYIVVARNPSADLRLRIDRVTPTRSVRSDRVFMTVYGGGFEPGAQVRLTRSGSTDVLPISTHFTNPWVLQAEFNLSQAEVGLYSVVAINPDGRQALRGNAFEVVAGAEAPQIEMEFRAPDSIRPNRQYIAYLDYRNIGVAPEEAPMIRVDTDPPVQVRLSDKEFWGRGSLLTMAVGTVQPDTLAPGESGRIAIYFKSPPTGGVLFSATEVLGVLPEGLADNWAAIETELRPLYPDIVQDAWDVIWPNLTSQIGSTSEQFMSAVRSNSNLFTFDGRTRFGCLNFLSTLGARANADLAPIPILAAGIDAAAPTPGIGLAFGRIAPATISGRRRVAGLGRGWAHNFEISMTFISMNGTGTAALIQGPVGPSRRFTSYDITNPDAWQGGPGDYGKLQSQPDGSFRLTEKSGICCEFNEGKLRLIRDTNGNQISLNYQGDRLVSVSHSNGESISLSYNAAGRIAGATDRVGRTTSYDYDASNLMLVRVRDYRDQFTQYEYFDAGAGGSAYALKRVTYSDGTQTNFTYDSFGALSGITSTNGAEPITITYPATNEYRISNGVSATAVVKVDASLLPVTETDPIGSTFTTRYDDQFNPVEGTGPMNRGWISNYDSKGNVSATTDSLQRRREFTYTNDFSNLEWLADARGVRTQYVSDSRGNVTEIRYPDGSRELFSYDSVGNVISATNRRGQTVTYYYNSLAQLTQVNRPDGSQFTYTYDARNNLQSAYGSLTGTITFTYDARDFLVHKELPGGIWFHYDYDSAGRLIRRSGHDGFSMNYRYDFDGRLDQITDGTGALVVTYEFDIAGRLARESKGNGTYTTYQYDLNSRVTNLTNYAPGGAVQSRFSYTYDPYGNPLTMTTADGVYRYTYDAADQLVGVQYPNGYAATAVYDAEGNRVQTNENGIVTNYLTNNLNQYTQAGGTTYSYDADGNLRTKIEGGITTTYEYDVDNRLTQVTSPGNQWSYTYDALGDRVLVTHNGVSTRYVHEGSYVAAEYDQSGLVARYLHGAGVVARVDANNTAYYAFDAIGHTRQLTNAAAAVVNAYDYKPFGGSVSINETVPNPFRYVGQHGVIEDDSGLFHMGARYYDPRTGRFTTPDPINIIGGVSLYAYVDNNPIALCDPSGLFPFIGRTGWTGHWEPIANRFGMNIFARNMPGGEGAFRVMAPISRGVVAHFSATGAFIEGGFGGAHVAFSNANTGTYWHNYWNYAVDVNDPMKMKYYTMGVKGQLIKTTRSGLTLLGKAARFAGRALGVVGLMITAWDFGSWLGDFLYNDGDNPFTVGLYEWFEYFGLARNPYVVTYADGANSNDPNEKKGPPGFGPQGWVRGQADPLAYTIYFENLSTATAPAQEVFVTDILDGDLDYSTFELTEIAFGDKTISMPAGAQQGSIRVPLDDSQYELIILVEFSPYTGRILWTFRTIDRLTGDLPEDAYAGFLPPNDETGRGEGHVSFRIQHRSGLASGVALTNKASIVFDTNAAIETNLWTNTLDNTPPTSEITPTSGQGDIPIELTWVGADAHSGIRDYTILVSDNYSPYVPWLENTTQTQAVYQGESGHSYCFYSLARDNAGNVQPLPFPPGDVNQDGCVNDIDLLMVLFAFGTTGSNLPEDTNSDGVVDDADLLIVLFNFGTGC